MAKSRMLASDRIATPPKPIETLVINGEYGDSLIARQWRASDDPRSTCRQCSECTVHPHGEGNVWVQSCAVYVPTEQVHAACFEGAKLEVTRPNVVGCAALAQIAGTQPPPPPPNVDDDEPPTPRRPALWSCEVTFRFPRSGWLARIELRVATRKRWERMAAPGSDYAHSWCVCNLWASLVLAVKLRLE